MDKTITYNLFSPEGNTFIIKYIHLILIIFEVNYSKILNQQYIQRFDNFLSIRDFQIAPIAFNRIIW